MRQRRPFSTVMIGSIPYRRIGAWAFLLLSLAAGCAQHKGTEARKDEVASPQAEAARREGKVVVYGNIPRDVMAQLTEVFQRRSPGIAVEYTQARAALSLEKIYTEARLGKHIADVVNGGAHNFVEVLEKDGLLQRFTPENARFIEATFIDSEGYLWPTYINLYGMLINTQLVPASEEPKKWGDLRGDQWKGKILVDDPSTTVGGGFTWFVTALSRIEDLGRAYLDQLARQQPTFSRQYLENEKAIARGEYAVYLPALEASIERLKGAPVKWIAPEDGLIVLPIASALLKDAPHPEAGKLWIDFMLTEEAQKILMEQGAPARTGVALPRATMSREGKRAYLVAGEEYRQGEKYAKLVREIFF